MDFYNGPVYLSPKSGNKTCTSILYKDWETDSTIKRGEKCVENIQFVFSQINMKVC